MVGYSPKSASRRAFLSGGLKPSASRSQLETRLRQEMRGDVLVDAKAKQAYSFDAARHHAAPIAVAVPQSCLDQRIALEIARDLKVPVISRGSGTSLSGQSVGEAMIIDTRRHLRSVLQLDLDKMRVTVEPGISLTALNATLARHGVWVAAEFPDDVQSTLGGMVATNAVGLSGFRYGDTASAVHAMDVVLADGTTARFGAFGDGGEMFLSSARLHSLIPQLFQIADSDGLPNRTSLGQGVMHRGGYNLAAFSSPQARPADSTSVMSSLVNFAQLLAGSEGTLATIQSVTLRLMQRPVHRAQVHLTLTDVDHLMSAQAEICALSPAAIAFRDLDLKGRILVSIDFHEDDARTLQQRVDALETLAVDLGTSQVMSSAVAASAIGVAQEAGRQEICFDDLLVPTPLVMDVMTQIDQIFVRHGVKGGWHGHAVAHGFYLRPVIRHVDLEPARLQDMNTAIGNFVTRFKEETVPRDLCVKIKAAFDPENLLNPGKIAPQTR